MKLSDFKRPSPTRYADNDISLYVAKTGDVWRILADQGGDCAAVGEHARTKFEAFTCVLPDVAKSYGFEM